MFAGRFRVLIWAEKYSLHTLTPWRVHKEGKIFLSALSKCSYINIHFKRKAKRGSHIKVEKKLDEHLGMLLQFKRNQKYAKVRLNHSNLTNYGVVTIVS